MQAHTEPPYRLTLKSNGCLILIAALSPVHLVVASKHSLGTTTEAQEVEKAEAPGSSLVDGMEKLSVKENMTNGLGDAKKGKGKATANGDAQDEEDGEREAEAHAMVGRRWVQQVLRAKGKTEAELANRLWEANLTAVLEVRLELFFRLPC